jgi:hypothetical protein
LARSGHAGISAAFPGLSSGTARRPSARSSFSRLRLVVVMIADFRSS